MCHQSNHYLLNHSNIKGEERKLYALSPCNFMHLSVTLTALGANSFPVICFQTFSTCMLRETKFYFHVNRSPHPSSLLCYTQKLVTTQFNNSVLISHYYASLTCLEY
jgi:hypothetical protein